MMTEKPTEKQKKEIRKNFKRKIEKMTELILVYSEHGLDAFEKIKDRSDVPLSSDERRPPNVREVIDHFVQKSSWEIMEFFSSVLGIPLEYTQDIGLAERRIFQIQWLETRCKVLEEDREAIRDWATQKGIDALKIIEMFETKTEKEK